MGGYEYNLILARTGCEGFRLARAFPTGRISLQSTAG